MKSKLLRGYFLSYVLLIITVFIVLAIIYAALLNFAQNLLEDAVITQIEQSAQMLENQIVSLDIASDQLNANEYLAEYRLSDGGYSTYIGVNELKKFRAFNSAIEDVFIYYSDDYLYSAKGKFDLAKYTISYNKLSEESQDILQQVCINKETLTEQFYPIYIESRTEEPSYLLCSYPMLSGFIRIGTIGYVVSMDTVTDTVSQLVDEYAMSITIRMSDGTLLAESISGQNIVASDSNSFFYTSMPSGFIYEVVVDEDRAFSSLNSLITINILLIGVLFVLSLIIAYFFSTRHYQPIKQIKSEFLKHVESGNEIDAIYRLLKSEGQEKKQLSNSLKKAHEITRQQAYEILFSGVFLDGNHINELMKTAEIRIETQCFYVLCIIYNNAEPTHDLKNYYYSNIMNNNAIFGIVEITDADHHRYNRRELAKKTSGYKYMCFGRIYSEYDDISKSYAEALVTAEQCLLNRSQGDIAFFEMLTISENVSPNTDLYRLIKAAIQKRDLKKTITEFEKILLEISNSNMQPDSIKFMLTDLLHHIYRCLTEIDVDTIDLMNADCSSFTRFEEQVKKQLRRALSVTSSKELINDILIYINQNYTSPQLTLTSIAEHFHISQNYMSRFFQNATGESYIKYVSSLRMEKAMQLLRETDINISDIVSSVGYMDVVSFNKKFKKQHNQTLAEYRNSFKKK